MSAHELLKEIRRLGCRVEARGDRLHIDAPEGIITPAMRDRLTEHKAEILRELALEYRLQDRGISIAIDRTDHTAWLLFKPEDAEIVKHCAVVYPPFEIELTESQRRELLQSLDYFERLERENQGGKP